MTLSPYDRSSLGPYRQIGLSRIHSFVQTLNREKRYIRRKAAYTAAEAEPQKPSCGPYNVPGDICPDNTPDVTFGYPYLRQYPLRYFFIFHYSFRDSCNFPKDVLRQLCPVLCRYRTAVTYPTACLSLSGARIIYV